jgi:hypothetical protein
MSKKKKPRRFRGVTAVKELARERIGTPRPTRVVPDRKKKKKEKHKPTLGKTLGESWGFASDEPCSLPKQRER